MDRVEQPVEAPSKRKETSVTIPFLQRASILKMYRYAKDQIDVFEFSAAY